MLEVPAALDCRKVRRPDCGQSGLSAVPPIIVRVFITVASYKGGVGKSTTAVHVAAYLQEKGPTVLIDGDPNRSVCGWALNGDLPFDVVHIQEAGRQSRN